MQRLISHSNVCLKIITHRKREVLRMRAHILNRADRPVRISESGIDRRRESEWERERERGSAQRGETEENTVKNMVSVDFSNLTTTVSEWHSIVYRLMYSCCCLLTCLHSSAYLTGRWFSVKQIGISHIFFSLLLKELREEKEQKRKRNKKWYNGSVRFVVIKCCRRNHCLVTYQRYSSAAVPVPCAVRSKATFIQLIDFD